MATFERSTKLLTSSFASVVSDIATVVSGIPAQIRSQVTDDRARLLASIMTMNVLWAVWMIFVDRVVVDMPWSAVADLRLSALFWNTVAAVVWTGHIERGLSALWQRQASARYRRMRWYWTALVISLLSQVPVQVVIYVPAMLWGDAVWSEVRWSWPLALFFSPVMGVYFERVQAKLEPILDVAFRRTLALPRQTGSGVCEYINEA